MAVASDTRTPWLGGPAEACATTGRTDIVSDRAMMAASQSEVRVPVAINASAELVFGRRSIDELATDVKSTNLAVPHFLGQLLLK